MNKTRNKVALALLASLVPTVCLAWGRDGHRITGYIAENFLKPHAGAAVGDLLEGKSLADVSTRADEFRRDPSYRWAGPLHYVNVEPGSDAFDMQRDCPVSGSVAVAWNESTPGVGKVRGFMSESPWPYEAPALDAGGSTTVRAAGGLVYAVSRLPGTVAVIDPSTWTQLYEHAVDPGCEPEDIAVITPQLAYISCAMGTHLLRINPETGVAVDAVDLSEFADDDGIPDMSKMTLHQGRLFVQVRRFDWISSTFVTPAMIVVIDVDTEQVIDVDPVAEGTQAIELEGTAPKFKMQIIEESRRLFVSASGDAWDAGGIEMIDLDSLQSLGLIVAETDGKVGVDLGAFVLVTPERGYLTFTTDFALSSHMVSFTVSGGVDSTSAIFTTVGYFVPTLAFDPQSGTFFLPDGAAPPFGVYVFDAATGELLTRDPVLTDGPPTDLAIVPPCVWDIDLSGDVRVPDLIKLLSCWGPLTGDPVCGCLDIDSSGDIRVPDLIALLAKWGVCP